MKKFRLHVMVVAAVALGACTANNNSKLADSGDGIMLDTAGLQGEWRLDSYRVDCESIKFESGLNYILSFNEPDNTFGITTDCNTIGGEFGIDNDTIRFKNALVTEKACDNMTVEQDMLRLFNDSAAYAMCQGDTLALTAPYIGSAIFIKHGNEDGPSARWIIHRPQ